MPFRHWVVRIFLASLALLTTTANAWSQPSKNSTRTSSIDRLDVLRRANCSTVRIEAVHRGRRTTDYSSGAGVVLSAGYVVTAHHVIHGYTDIVILTENGERQSATVTWVDDALDLALLRVAGKAELEPACIAPTANIREGKAAVVIGNPLGQGQKIVTGRLGPERLVHWDGRSAELRAIVADVVPGNSGGGAYDLATGELLGVTVAKSATQANTGYVVPADRIAELVEEKLSLRELSDTKEIRQTLGVTMRPVRLKQGRVANGMLVTHVQSGCAAAAAGWKEGDVLVGLGRYKMQSVSDVVFVLQGAKHESMPISFHLAGAPVARMGNLQLDGAESPPAVYVQTNPSRRVR